MAQGLQPLTGDTNGRSRFSIGGGVVITTGDNGQVAPMATVGLDVPITDAVSASISVDAGFLDQHKWELL